MKQLFQDWLFEAGYVSNGGNKLTRFFHGNQALMDYGGVSVYHGLQTKVEKRWGKGLSFLHAFAYGRALDNVNAWCKEQSGAASTPQDAYNFRNECGPGRPGRHDLLAPGGPDPVGRMGGQRDLDLAAPACRRGSRCQSPGVLWTTDRWFNPDAFREAPSPLGTAGRNTVYGPGFNGWDMTFAKSFPFGETRRLQFRTEVFNIFNQVNLDRPGNNASSRGSLGRVSSALEGRSIPLGLKFYWKAE